MIFEKLFLAYYLSLRKNGDKGTSHEKLIEKSVHLVSSVVSFAVIYLFMLVVYVFEKHLNIGIEIARYKWYFIIIFSVFVLVFDFRFGKHIKKKNHAYTKVDSNHEIQRKQHGILIFTGIFLIGPPILLFLSLFIF